MGHLAHPPGRSPDKTAPLEALLPSQAKRNAELTRMGDITEHLTRLFPPLAAAPERIQPRTNAWLVKQKAHRHSPLPSTESAGMQAGLAVGPQSVEVVKKPGLAGSALAFGIRWHLQDRPFNT